MTDPAMPEPGAEPGLRFACVLDGRGGAIPLTWAALATWRTPDGVLWVHLERDHPDARAWVRHQSGIEPVIAETLIAEESRPRVERFDDALLIVLRGVNQLACASAESGAEISEDDLDLVPCHLWINDRRVISLRDQDHQLSALREIRTAHLRGKGPTRPGELLAQIADKIVKDLEPVLDRMDEQIDELEAHLAEGDAQNLRTDLSRLRRRAIHLRRYLSPQRDALNRLRHEEASWLNRHDRLMLREVADKLMRFIEYLDSIRDRSTILHEDLSSLMAERAARTSNRLTGLAALLLPPSVIAGLLGMNVGGIPAASDPWGFFYALLAVAGLTGVIYGLLRRARWL